jgi:hypothetical protein
MDQECNLFAGNVPKDPNRVFSCIPKFLQFRRERAENWFFMRFDFLFFSWEVANRLNQH